MANSGSEERNSYLRQQYEWQFRARSNFKTLIRHETDLDVKMPRGIDVWAVSVELFSFFAAVLYCNKLDSSANRSE